MKSIQYFPLHTFRNFLHLVKVFRKDAKCRCPGLVQQRCCAGLLKGKICAGKQGKVEVTLHFVCCRAAAAAAAVVVIVVLFCLRLVLHHTSGVRVVSLHIVVVAVRAAAGQPAAQKSQKNSTLSIQTPPRLGTHSIHFISYQLRKLGMSQL